MSLYNLLLTLWCLVTIEICSTVATSQLLVSPDTFDVVAGPALTVNCTFHYDNTSSIFSLTSITLSKGDDLSQAKPNLTEIASVVFFDPNVVNVFIPINATTNGLIGKDGQSFLSLYWKYPSLNEEGLYQCNITGLDRMGNSIEISHTSKVTADRSDVTQLTETVRKQQIYIDDLQIALNTLVTKQSFVENTLSQWNKSLENIASNLTLALTDINNRLNQLEMFKTLSFFFVVSSEHNGTSYLLSKLVNVHINDSQSMCGQVGGYLAEIDDAGEQAFIQNFLTNLAVDNVITGGTDEGHKGQWIWRKSQRAMSYTNWYTNDLGSSTQDKCVDLYRSYNWQWYDEDCTAAYNYLCEVPKF